MPFLSLFAFLDRTMLLQQITVTAKHKTQHNNQLTIPSNTVHFYAVTRCYDSVIFEMAV
jgi:hypothetical protein